MHTLKIGCVCTDEDAVSTGRNLLKIKHTKAFSRVCYINTTTLNSVSSSTRVIPHRISIFRELLPCVTLWIAALSQGSVGKILTHPHPLSCDVSSGANRDRGAGSNVKEGP